MNDNLQDLIATMEARVKEFTGYVANEIPPLAHWEGRLDEAEFVLKLLKESKPQ